MLNDSNTVNGFSFCSVFFFFMQTAQMMKVRMKSTMAIATAAITIGIMSSPELSVTIQPSREKFK